MHRVVRQGCSLLVLASLMLVSVGAAADGADWPPQVDPVYPHAGIYYDAQRSGTGLTLGVSPDQRIFAAFYTYDEAGNPFYYLIQGKYVAETDALTLIDHGPIGQLTDAVVYYSTDGECVGAGCVYKTPERHKVPIDVSMVWLTPTQVELSLGDQSWSMQTLMLPLSLEDYLEREWTIGTAAYPGPDGVAGTPDESPVFGFPAQAYEFQLTQSSPADFNDCSYPGLSSDVPMDSQLYVLRHGANLYGVYLYYSPGSQRTGIFNVTGCGSAGSNSTPGWHSSRVFILGPIRFRVLSYDVIKGQPLVRDIRYTVKPVNAMGAQN